MTEQAPLKPRSRKIYILWAIALTLLISTALFCWLVVVPFLGVRRVLSNAAGHGLVGGVQGFYVSEDVFKELGGSGQALRKLTFYLSAPRCLQSNRVLAADVLKYCGQDAIPVLQRLAKDGEADVRGYALNSLAAIKLRKERGPLREDVEGVWPSEKEENK